MSDKPENSLRTSSALSHPRKRGLKMNPPPLSPAPLPSYGLSETPLQPSSPDLPDWDPSDPETAGPDLPETAAAEPLQQIILLF